MKIETVVLFLKAVCMVAIGFCAPYGASLAQWANSGEGPSSIQWKIIYAASIGGGANALLGFLSSSFKDYIDAKRKKGDTEFTPKP